MIASHCHEPQSNHGADRRDIQSAAGACRVPDVDSLFRSEWYGDRSAGLEDAWGNQWWLATHIEDVSSEELERRMAAAKQ